MLTLILLLVLASTLTYLAQYNLISVVVNFGPYAYVDMPLFYVIVGSLVCGLILGYLIYLVEAISTSFVIRSKETEIKKGKDEVLELTKRVHQLELENEKLKHTPVLEVEDENAL